MPAFLPHFLALAARIQAYAGPLTLDGREGYSVRPDKVELVIATVAGALGDPDAAPVPGDSSITEIIPRPYVDQVSAREVLDSGGRYQAADLKVGPIIPAYDGGGYTPAQLLPTSLASTSLGDATSTEVYYRLTGGPLAGEYEIVGVSTDDPTAYYVTLRKLGRTP